MLVRPSRVSNGIAGDPFVTLSDRDLVSSPSDPSFIVVGMDSECGASLSMSRSTSVGRAGIAIVIVVSSPRLMTIWLGCGGWTKICAMVRGGEGVRLISGDLFIFR